MASVNRTLHQVGDTLRMHIAVLAFWKAGLGFQKPLHLNMTGKTARCVSLQRILNDRGQRFDPREQLAVSVSFLVAIADRGREHPIASLDALAHFLAGLSPVLFAFQLALGGKDGFNEFAFGRIFELEVQTFDTGMADLKLAAQLNMEFSIASKTFEIIEDHNVGFVTRGIKIAQERDHTGALHEVACARDIVRERGFDLISLRCRIFTATGFLTFQTMASSGLRHAGNPAVYDRMLGSLISHGEFLSVARLNVQIGPVNLWNSVADYPLQGAVDRGF